MINSKTVRLIVLAEVLVCFVPLAGLLLMGFLFTPFVVLEMLEGRFGGVQYLVAVACGVAGFTALFQVVKWLFGRQTGRLGRWWTLVLMLLGLLPVALIFADTVFDWFGPRQILKPDWYMLPVWAAPILVTAHLAYLARHYLFHRYGKQ